MSSIFNGWKFIYPGDEPPAQAAMREPSHKPDAGAGRRQHLAARRRRHQIGLADLLSVAGLRDLAPRQAVLIGVQPAALETGLELSPASQAQLPLIMGMVLEELRGWGYAAERRQAACPSPKNGE